MATQAGCGHVAGPLHDAPVVHDLEIAAPCQLVLGIVASGRSAMEPGRYASDLVMADSALRLGIDRQGRKMMRLARMACRTVRSRMDSMVKKDGLVRQFQSNGTCGDICRLCSVCRDHQQKGKHCRTAQRKQRLHKNDLLLKTERCQQRLTHKMQTA